MVGFKESQLNQSVPKKSERFSKTGPNQTDILSPGTITLLQKTESPDQFHRATTMKTYKVTVDNLTLGGKTTTFVNIKEDLEPNDLEDVLLDHVLEYMITWSYEEVKEKDDDTRKSRVNKIVS